VLKYLTSEVPPQADLGLPGKAAPSFFNLQTTVASSAGILPLNSRLAAAVRIAAASTIGMP
jgi:hypothetical protein